MSTDPNDLQQPDNTDSSNASGTSPAGQSNGTDWENRFKGLQREYDQLKRSLSAKEGVATRLQNELNSANAQLQSLTSDYEGQLTSLRAEKDSFASQVTEFQSTNEKLSSQVAGLERDKAIRKELAKPENAGLSVWYDAGHLNIPKEFEIGGDDMTNHLKSFKTLLDGQSAADFQKQMSSATPPQFGTQNNASTGGMSYDELTVWLRANPTHPDFARYENAWLDLAAQQQ